VSFTSLQFILVFLPLAYGGFVLANRLGGWNWAMHFLAVVSLAFYATFGISLLLILLGSIVANYRIGLVISSKAEDRVTARRFMLTGIIANLSLLGYLKYTNFFIDVANQFTGSGISHLYLLLPIGVSFFTFVQIGYLIDAFNGQLISHNFSRYVIFSAFFPCVTAGPLVLQKDMMQQLAAPQYKPFDMRRVVVGVTMFGMGMFKKVVLADNIAPYADGVFNAAALGAGVDADTAWIGALCYALQLYFDFSGYSDMALGIGTIFGIKLPLNFDSPFKATNISDFWRRWHMTMTRFFTNYVYTGLAIAGMRKAMINRLGPVRKFILTAAIPPVITFLVAGAWHGAGWNFVVYGLVHGLAIATYLAWREFSSWRLHGAVAWSLTMAVVVSGLVIFRAADLGTAGSILGHMWLSPFEYFVAGGHVHIEGLDRARAVALIVVLGAVAILLPNTQQILHHDWPTSDQKPENTAQNAGFLGWRPSLGNAMVTALAYTIAVTLIGSGTGFLYYQF
jgi:alginate O-acetyltransferase complex protein AlgI